MPTILDLLGLQGSYKADGWSMINPQRDGQRMAYSTSNPGTHMIIRDGDFVIVTPNKEEKTRNTLAEVADLSKDPLQKNPIFLDSDKHLTQWGLKVKKNLEMICWRPKGLGNVVTVTAPCHF